MSRSTTTYTLARRWPPRMDVSAEVDLPDARRGRVAHQIRQDLWRDLRSVRGFAPVVEVTRSGSGLKVMAGGQVDGAIPPGMDTQIAALLNDPVRRARWLAHAQTSPRDEEG